MTQRILVISTVGTLAAVLFMSGCEQRQDKAERAGQPAPTGNSSQKKETHPEQPTGKPESGDPAQTGRTK
jgi:hypothetical protein